MEEKEVGISDEVLQNISTEELADLKVEVDELVDKLHNIAEDCKKVLNS